MRACAAGDEDSGAGVTTLYCQRKREADFAARWAKAAARGAAVVDALAKGGVAPASSDESYRRGKDGRMRMVRIADPAARWNEGAKAIFIDHLPAGGGHRPTVPTLWSGR